MQPAEKIFTRRITTNRLTFFFFQFLFLMASASQAQRYQPEPITAVLGAFEPELQLLRQSLEQPEIKIIHGISFATGRLNGRQVVIAETGIGKTNAAMTTAFILAYFKPQQVLFSGIAGGVNPDLNPGDIVIARQTIHHDYGWVTFQQQQTRQTRNAITKEMNPAFFPADTALLRLAQETAGRVRFEAVQGQKNAPSVRVGTVVTGDVFVSSEDKVRQLRNEFGADATEMEGAAVAQVCYQLQVPCLVIRSLSDKANASARQDMMNFLQIAARNSANLVMAIVGRLK